MPSELVGCHVPHQHETGEVAAELEPLAAVAHRLGHVRGIDAQRDDVLARQDAGDDVEHRPAFFIGMGNRAVDAPAGQDLRRGVAVRGFDQLDGLAHRHQAAGVFGGQHQRGCGHGSF